MWASFERRAIRVACIGFMVAASVSTVHSQPAQRQGKDKVMTAATPYSVAFASPRRDSASAARTAATGTVAWSVEIGKPGTPEWPPSVLLWGPLQVVATASDIAVFDDSGKRLWAQVKQVTTPVAVGPEQLYFKNKHLFLEALSAQQQHVLTDAPFPSAMKADISVRLLWPRAKDFIAVMQSPGSLEVAEGDSPDKRLPKPTVTVLRNDYPTTYGDWAKKYPGTLALEPLFSPDTQVMALFFDEVIRLDVARRSELSRFKVPLERVVEWSVDADEVYCFTGYVGTRKTVLAMSAAGVELWRWTDTALADPWLATQPPVRAAGGRVLVLTQGRLLAIDKGKLAWQYDALGSVLQHGAHIDEGSFEVKDGRLLAKGSLRHATVLGDGSVLVTANKTLHHVDAQGHKRFSVNVGADILSPPVVDEAGHVFVATATHLIRID